MISFSPSTFGKSAPLVLSTLALLSATAGAVVVASSDLSTNLPGLTFDSPVTDITASYGTTGPGGSRAVELIDGNSASGAAGVARYTPPSSNPFSTASAGQSELQVRFDLAVTSLGATSTNSNQIPRVVLRNTTDTTQGLTVGFGQDSLGNLVLFAAKGDSVTPATSNALTRFNFGTYDTATAANNDTNGYVSISISLLHGGTTMRVSASQGGSTLFDGDVTGFTSNSFSNTNTLLIMATGQTGTSNLFVDNLFIQTIPEPATALLGSLAALGLLRRRR